MTTLSLRWKRSTPSRRIHVLPYSRWGGGKVK